MLDPNRPAGGMCACDLGASHTLAGQTLGRAVDTVALVRVCGCVEEEEGSGFSC